MAQEMHYFFFFPKPCRYKDVLYNWILFRFSLIFGFQICIKKKRNKENHNLTYIQFGNKIFTIFWIQGIKSYLFTVLSLIFELAVATGLLHQSTFSFNLSTMTLKRSHEIKCLAKLLSFKEQRIIWKTCYQFKEKIVKCVLFTISYFELVIFKPSITSQKSVIFLYSVKKIR